VDHDQPSRVIVDGIDVTSKLRSPAVDRDVSTVAALPAVRAALVGPQRRLVEAAPAVVVGRDIGTTIFPDALLKVYLDASLAERARRRGVQFSGQEQRADAEAAASELDRRDQVDRERTAAPLRPAPDAVRIDTDALSVEQVVDRILTELCQLAGLVSPRPQE
jgi:cytidylate kinase